jgi:hypothetical protein
MKTALPAIAVAVSVLSVGCAWVAVEPKPAERVVTAVTAGDWRAEIFVPVYEPVELGTYKAVIHFPDGRTQAVRRERSGRIEHIMMANLAGDEAPELIVAMAGTGREAFGSVDALRLAGKEFVPDPVAPLTDDQAKLLGYMGHDRFELREGRLVRAFPIYHPDDPMAKPSGGTARLGYDFENAQWMEMKE